MAALVAPIVGAYTDSLAQRRSRSSATASRRQTNGSMPTLYHHPLCPHSRFVRLILAEYGIETTLIEERASRASPRVSGCSTRRATRRCSSTTTGRSSRAPRSSPNIWTRRADPAFAGDAAAGARRRARAPRSRRLVEWFNVKFFEEVTNWLVTEKVYKRFARRARSRRRSGHGRPAGARANVRHHMRYIGYLTGRAELARGRQAELRRFRRRRASLLRRLSGRRSMGRGRDGQALVSADQIAPGLPSAARGSRGGDDAGGRCYADLDF